jgi:predicted metal-dependent enzyme (double-stranded beta helix superfamily)
MNDCKAKTWPAPALSPQQQQLLEALACHLDDETRLLELATDFETEGDYPHAPHCYSRTILYRHPQGAEIMVARWDAGASTPTHGHPQYAFVLVLEGRLQMEHFNNTADGLELTETLIRDAGEHIYAAGQENRYDNAIHRVTALEPSLSLHIYSDDALKGICYD